MSEGTQLRDVLIAHKKRRYDLVALLLLSLVALAVLVATSILDPGFFALTFAAAEAVCAVVVLHELALALFGHKRVIVDGETLLLRFCIAPRITRGHRLPLLQIRCLSSRHVEHPWSGNGNDVVGSSIQIARVEYGEHGRRPWRIVLGVRWTPEELAWLVDYLESGIALARRAAG